MKGNPGKRPVIDSGIVADGSPFTPDFISDDAKACIEEIKRSMPPATYARLDSFALTAYATAWSNFKAATEALAAEGYMEKGSVGQRKQSEWLKVQSDSSAKMMSWGDRLGLDPKSRAALGAKPEEKPKSKFDGLLGGKAN